MGEQLQVQVLSQSADGKVLLQIKNGTLTADAPGPLPAGQRLTVQVDQLLPSVILRLIGPETAAEARVGDLLRFYRSNPEALKEMFSQALALLGLKNTLPLPELSKTEPQALRDILANLFGSKEALADPALSKTEPQALRDILANLFGSKEALADPALSKTELQTLRDLLTTLFGSKETPAKPALSKTELQTLRDLLANLAGSKETPANPALSKTEPQTLRDLLANLINVKETPADPPLSKTELQTLRNLLANLIGSKETLANPLFLKQHIESLGLTGESRLMKALTDPALLQNARQDTPAVTLKGVLLELAAKLASLPSREQDAAGPQLTRQWSAFAEQALKVIESLQVVNILAGEKDGLFTIQIPFLFPHGLRMQDLYIETDQGREDEQGTPRHRVVLFLDMDALGEMVVDAGIAKEGLNCLIKCRDAEVRDFIKPLLPGLQEGLARSGYPDARIQCLLETGISEWKKAFVSQYQLYQHSTVDFCA